MRGSTISLETRHVCFFVRSGSDGLLKLWTIKNNECVKTFDEHKDKVWALATTSDETSLITGGGDSNIIVWKVGCRDNTFVFPFLLVPIWKVFVEYPDGAIGILQDLYSSSFGFSRQESSQRIFHLHFIISSSTTAMSSLAASLYLLLGLPDFRFLGSSIVLPIHPSSFLRTCARHHSLASCVFSPNRPTCAVPLMY